MKQKVMVNTND